MVAAASPPAAGPAAAFAIPGLDCWVAGLLGCWAAGLLVGDIWMTKTGLAPGNLTPFISRKWCKEVHIPFSSKLLSLLPSAGGLEGIRME